MLKSETSYETSDSETEYSDSGAEIDETVDLSLAEKARQEFNEKLELLLNKFRDDTDKKIAEFIGPIQLIPIPSENPPPVSTSNIFRNNRRKSILPHNLEEISKLPLPDNSKKEFDIQSSLTQSKKKIKKFLRQLRKEDESTPSDKDDEVKKINDHLKKSDKSAEKSSREDRKSQLKCHNDKNDEKDLCVYGDSKIFKVRDRRICVAQEKVLRDEITNLRITRDFLVEQRKNLDTKLNRDRSYSYSEQRRFIELDEAIEAIDSTIEYKNGSICGKKSFEERSREEGEQMLLDRLMNLSESEMRSLLYKYFQKTVDLRDWGRKLEQEIAELDHKIEAQAWKIQALSGALELANVENERRLVTVHREHEEKLHLMFRHYTGTGTGTSSSADTRADEPRALPPPTSPNPGAIPQQNLRKLQATSSSHTTKVTREKNKLIIQQHHRK